MRTSTVNRRVWDSDAASTNGKTSLAVLLDWLKHDGNYDRWQRGAKAGHSKQHLCNEIVAAMHSHGLHHRAARDVRSKLNELERSYRAAAEWRARTGERSNDSAADVRTQVLKLCKHYDVLLPIMRDPLVIRPLVTTETVETIETPLPVSNSESREHTSIRPIAAHDTAVSGGSGEVQTKGTKRKADVLLTVDVWKQQMSVEATSVEAKRLVLEEIRLNLDAKRLDLETKRLETEMGIAHIERAKKKGLARQELRAAGVPESEIDQLLPLV